MSAVARIDSYQTILKWRRPGDGDIAVRLEARDGDVVPEGRHENSRPKGRPRRGPGKPSSKERSIDLPRGIGRERCQSMPS